ncbi:MAG: hypothetical protein OEU09_18925 [Rhodospirillales bacterium]|nr:hypothetical protein [Rhodospirillales bacterium]MDH3970278.1 hypothetical protein [Rhodospirillales bacterium]
MERRLAAIFSADMVGYSRLMEADEAGTIARQKTHRRELIDPKIAEYGGRIVKTTGDGLLVEFPSVVDAVRCAVTIQLAMPGREKDLPAQQHITYRVGINLGDIVVEDDDIQGDGVNIASRLEGLSDPGGIVVSGTVVEQVQGKVVSGFEDLGEQAVKNIAKPVHVYRVDMRPELPGEFMGGDKSTIVSPKRLATIGGVAALVVLAAVFTWQLWPVPASEEQRVELGMPDRPSIAVLAFDNFTSDPKQSFLGDGLAEDIITELSRNVDLRVIARHSSFSFKKSELSAQEIAEKLGVRYVLEGSVRRVGDTLRVNAQLIDGHSNQHVWAERFNVSAAEIYEVQDKIVAKIVGSMFSEIRETQKRDILRKPPNNLDVYELTLRGVARKHRFTKQDYIVGHEELTRATELDPGYAPAWLYLGYLETVDIGLGMTGQRDKDDVDAAIAKLHKAIRLDPELPTAYQALSLALQYKGDFDEALHAAAKSVELGPGDAENVAFLALALFRAGQYERAGENIERALALNPQEPIYYLGIDARIKWAVGRYEDAVKASKTCLQRLSSYLICRLTHIVGLVGAGNQARAVEEALRLKAEAPGPDFSVVRDLGPSGDPAGLERWIEHLKAAGFGPAGS